MKLRDGRFIDNNGNKVKPEFGNLEQIELLKAVEKRHLALAGEGLGVTCTNEFDDDGNDIDEDAVFVRFECVCGMTVSQTFYSSFYGLDGEMMDCYCGKDYVLDSNSYGVVVAKYAETLE